MNGDFDKESTKKTGGSLDEALKVVGSSPTHRTNFPATFTPDWLAADMVALANIEPQSHVLEPSAGQGALVRAIHHVPHGSVEAIELNSEYYNVLREMNCNVRRGDFLEMHVRAVYNRVLMNPPQQDVKEHVMKAAAMLRPFGRLVALVHRSEVNHLHLKLRGSRVYHLPRYTFVMDGKYLAAALLVWDRP